MGVGSLMDKEARKVVLETSLGEIELELYPEKAPVSVKNFLDYVSSGFYNGTIFHRTIAGFMIQGGGFTADMQQKPTRAPIKNEAANGLPNGVGSIAMARTGVVDSATAQFFINVANNAQLNYRDSSPAGFGYAVFGRVTRGMDVVKLIEAAPTTARPPHQNVPVTPIIINSARIVR